MFQRAICTPVSTCRCLFTRRCSSAGAKAGNEVASSKGKSKTAKVKSTTSAQVEASSSKLNESSVTGDQSTRNQPAGNEYKAVEYYQHTADTYADLMVQMASKRLPRVQRPGRD